MNPIRTRRKKEKGVALVISFLIFMLLAVAGAEYADHATQALRISRRRQLEIQTINLCEGGVQEVLQNLWTPFKVAQVYNDFDPATQGASVASPTASVQDTIPGVGAFAAGVIKVTEPDTYTRIVTVRSVGWIDINGNGALDGNEPFKVVDVTATFALNRSAVFDYTYFINNYGWMDGFNENDLIVNGDMRANGDFNFTNGAPTVNGSVIATFNQKLVPTDQGLVNSPPVKWSDSTYVQQQTAGGANAANDQNRWRQGYNAATFGAQGTSQYETYKDLTFHSNGSVDATSSTLTGSIKADANGVDTWTRTDSSLNAATTLLDNTPTQELVMPDLSDLTTYQNLSSSYTDPLNAYADGSPNPNFGKGAYVEVWNTSTNKYDTVTTNGNISGSAILVGTSAHPIILHGPSTVSQDILIKGVVSGQGTLYAGRNVHVVGSVVYNDPPSTVGSSAAAIDLQNSKADILALAARGSVIMGNPNSFSNPYPLYYMTPPFTIGRYDDNGNWIPPYNALNTDSSGRMLYQSVVSDSVMNSIAENVDQIDAIMYTNFVGGGDIGTGGSGLKMNGSIISKNEAMVTWSLPMHENYDNRIHERALTDKPLIDVNLPRTPNLLQSTWQDRGFSWVGA